MRVSSTEAKGVAVCISLHISINLFSESEGKMVEERGGKRWRRGEREEGGAG